MTARSYTLGFSFGYLIPDGGSVKRADGVREIHRLDVFEVSAAPAPMNNGTRVLSTKALDEHDRIRDQWRDDMVRILNADTGQKAIPTKPVGPVQVATFDA